jgi:hypothetical protein
MSPHVISRKVYGWQFHIFPTMPGSKCKSPFLRKLPKATTKHKGIISNGVVERQSASSLYTTIVSHYFGAFWKELNTEAIQPERV